jgi:hypothetical protein
MPLVILHHLLNVSVQLINKREFRKKSNDTVRNTNHIASKAIMIASLSPVFHILHFTTRTLLHQSSNLKKKKLNSVA